MKQFKDLFKNPYPIIGCVHLKPLPGSVEFNGNLDEVYEMALKEALVLEECGVDGIIVENFGDAPFYPDEVPQHTIACMTVVVDRIVKRVSIPVGINVLRNDAIAAVSIAHATGAAFVRVNIHMHAMLTDQGLIQGKSYETLRFRSMLNGDVMIIADINVKHAQSLVEVDLKQWTLDLQERGKADAIIVSGSGTGKAIDASELSMVYDCADVPVLIGSGFTPGSAPSLIRMSHGAIVGSYLKKNGLVRNPIDPRRVGEVLNSVRK